MTARDDRLKMGAGAILTLPEAAQLLGWKNAKRWLRSQGLVTQLLVEGESVERVVWRDVLTRMSRIPLEGDGVGAHMSLRREAL